MEYDKAWSFSEGLAAVKKGNGWGFIDNVGEVFIKPVFDDAYSFSEGLAPVEMNGLWGFTRKVKGIWSGFEIPLLYEDTRHFSEGLVAVKSKGKWGYIDKHGTDTLRTALRV